MKKYVNTVIVLIISLLLLSGCTSLDGVTAQAIKTNMLQAYQNVSTYSFSISITMQTDMSAGGSFEIEGNGEVDLVNEKLMMEQTMSMDLMNIGSVTTSTYIIDRIIYTGTDMFDISQWKKQNISNATQSWRSYDQMQTHIQLLGSSTVERASDEEKNGISCYVLHVQPDSTTLFDVLQTTSEDSSTTPQLDYAEAIQEFTVKQWIAKDTNLPVKVLLTMTIETDTATIDYTTEMTLSAYNEPVTIELPEDAQNAEWLSS